MDSSVMDVGRTRSLARGTSAQSDLISIFARSVSNQESTVTTICSRLDARPRRLKASSANTDPNSIKRLRRSKSKSLKTLQALDGGASRSSGTRVASSRRASVTSLKSSLVRSSPSSGQSETRAKSHGLTTCSSSRRVVTTWVQFPCKFQESSSQRKSMSGRCHLRHQRSPVATSLTSACRSVRVLFASATKSGATFKSLSLSLKRPRR